MRQVNEAGLDLIKSFEGCRLKAYLDTGGVPTIGWGRTKGVKMGDVCTQEQADAWFKEEIETEYAPAVEKLVKISLTDNEFGALVSFHYNTGALGKSTLLRKLNSGDKFGASLEFGKWVNDNGKVIKGLVRRRQAEKELFLKG